MEQNTISVEKYKEKNWGEIYNANLGDKRKIVR